MSVLWTAALKAGMGIIAQFATAEFLEWAIFWLAEKAAKHSDAKWDDELVAKMKKERAKKDA